MKYHFSTCFHSFFSKNPTSSIKNSQSKLAHNPHFLKEQHNTHLWPWNIPLLSPSPPIKTISKHLWPWNSPLLLTQKPTASCLLCNLKTCSPATPRLWCCIFPGWFVWRLLSHFLVCRRQLGPPLLLQPLKDKIITQNYRLIL